MNLAIPTEDRPELLHRVSRGLCAARKLVMDGVIDSHLYNAYRTERMLFGFVRGGRSARFHVRSA